MMYKIVNLVKHGNEIWSVYKIIGINLGEGLTFNK
jgi:hypothetical protein